MASGKAPGYALPAFLVVLAAMSLAIGQAASPPAHRAAKEREAELLFRGMAYANAIRSYYLAEPDPAMRRLPGSVDALLRDPRTGARHLRRAYPDPFFATVDTPFRLLRGSPAPGIPDGVIGVASTSTAPLKRRIGWAPDPDSPLTTAGEVRFLADLKTADMTTP